MLGIPVKHLLHKKAFPIVEEEKLTWCSERCWKSHRCLFSAKWTYSSEPDISAHHTYVGASSWRDSTRLSISESQHVTVRLLSLTDWNLTFGIRSPSLKSRGPLGNLFLTFHEIGLHSLCKPLLGLANFFYKELDNKYSGLSGPCFLFCNYSILTLQRKSSPRGYVNGGLGCVPVKLIYKIRWWAIICRYLRFYNTPSRLPLRNELIRLK